MVCDKGMMCFTPNHLEPELVVDRLEHYQGFTQAEWWKMKKWNQYHETADMFSQKQVLLKPGPICAPTLKLLLLTTETG